MAIKQGTTMEARVEEIERGMGRLMMIKGKLDELTGLRSRRSRQQMQQ